MDYVRSVQFLAERVREIREDAASRNANEHLHKSSKLLEKIEEHIPLVRSEVEGVRLANTRPKTDRNTAFILQAKARLSTMYDKLEQAVAELDTTAPLDGEAAPESSEPSVPQSLENKKELVQEVMNMTRIAMGASQNETKKRELGSLLEAVANEDFSCDVLERIKETISANPALPPESIREVRKVMNDN
ncbi:hypothetical protein [uncultured Litoreibacter sp.]|uniref:hypothetical protein n=1 Tax=uncultured Litoreibacter sp. TaxID=1392394 RepID=UPI0026058460|nr:hypothetical protein [uncultured Litoreibacter sp.]